MSMEARKSATCEMPLGRLEQLRLAKEIVRREGEALTQLASHLNGAFCQALEFLSECEGSVIVSGMGKAGLVGQKITATLASTGTRSHFLHPAEAIHGDLGRVGPEDVVLMLSQSGETEEIVRLLEPLAAFSVPLIAITGNAQSTLARAATVTLDLGPMQEACPLGLAPSTSTTAMMALGDALALVASHKKKFAPEDFARFHPGGSLGKKLAKVEEVMRPICDCRVAPETWSIRQVFVEVSRPGRRTGAIMITGEAGVLTGVFTDSDLARLFESGRNEMFDEPICSVMTPSPTTIEYGTALTEAVDILAARKISELPVIDRQGRPLGMIDVTDVVALLPRETPPTQSAASPHFSPGSTTLPPYSSESVSSPPLSKKAAKTSPKTLPMPQRTDK